MPIRFSGRRCAPARPAHGWPVADARQGAGSAGEHHPRRQQPVVSRALDLLQHQPEDLLYPRFDDMGQFLAADLHRVCPRQTGWTVKYSSGPTSAATACPCWILISSACDMGRRRPWAISEVMWLPPTASTVVCHTSPSI